MTGWAWLDSVLFGLGWVVLAAGVVVMLVMWRRVQPQRPFPVRMGVLLAAASATGLLAVVLRLATGAGGVPDRLLVCALFLLLPIAVVLYPDDRPPAGLGWTTVAVVAVAGGVGVAYPDAYAKTGLVELVVLLLLLAVGWWRYEHTDRAGRRALLWLTLGMVPGWLLTGKPLTSCGH